MKVEKWSLYHREILKRRLIAVASHFVFPPWGELKIGGNWQCSEIHEKEQKLHARMILCLSPDTGGGELNMTLYTCATRKMHKGGCFWQTASDARDSFRDLKSPYLRN